MSKVLNALFVTRDGGVTQYPLILEDEEFPETIDFNELSGLDEDLENLIFDKVHLPYWCSVSLYQERYLDPRHGEATPPTREEVIEQCKIVLRQDERLLGSFEGWLDWVAMRSEGSQGYEDGVVLSEDDEDGLAEMAKQFG